MNKQSRSAGTMIVNQTYYNTKWEKCQMSFDSLMKDTFDTQRRTWTGAYDDYGQKIYEWEDHLSAQPCLLQARRGQASEVTDVHGTMVISTHRLYCRICDVAEADPITVTNGAGGPDPSAATRSFDIISIEQAAGQHHHLQMELRAIEPEQE